VSRCRSNGEQALMACRSCVHHYLLFCLRNSAQSGQISLVDILA